jgi:hypothetical protein
VRANSNEVDIQALVSAAILAQPVTSKIFEIYPPALFGWQVGGKLMLRSRWPFADALDVMPDLKG